MDLFDQSNTPLQENTPPQIDNYLDFYTGEKGKFHRDSKEEALELLAKSKYHSDTYVPILEKRLDEREADLRALREEMATRAKLEDIYDRLSKQPLASNEQPNVNEEQTNRPNPYDPKAIEDIVLNKISEHERQRLELANYNNVVQKLKQRYGDNYQQQLQDQMNSLGLSRDDLNSMARKHPQVLYKTLGLDQQQTQETFQTPPRNEMRADSFVPTSGQKRTWSWYQKMKRTDPQQYNSPQTAIQMHKDAIALGEDFKDGNFNE